MTDIKALPAEQAVSSSDDMPRSPQDEQGADDSIKQEEPPKKRRRVAKPNAEKKFECKHEGCGKSYSRAEHLYRHQLNHTPKTIYRCDYPDCNRYFVRQDLCIRHRERHTTHGSQLHKRDTFANSTNQQNAGPPLSPQQQMNNSGFRQPGLLAKPPQDSNFASSTNSHFNDNIPYPPPQNQSHFSNPAISPAGSTDPRLIPPTIRPDNIHRRTSSVGSNPLSPSQKPNVPSWDNGLRTYSDGSNNINGQNSYMSADQRFSSGSSMVPPSPIRAYSASSSTNQNWSGMRPPSDGIISRNSSNNAYMSMSNSTGNNFGSNDFSNQSISRTEDAAFAAAVSQGLHNARTDPYQYGAIQSIAGIDMNNVYNYPIFGNEEYNQTPFALADDFTAWLFNDAQSGSTDFSPSNYIAGYTEPVTNQSHGPHFSQSPTSSGAGSTKLQMQHPMSVTSILDNTERSQYIMSQEKRKELLLLMQNSFVERPHDAVKKRKDSVFEGDLDADGHILSLRMMHTYIGSYWYHQHAQLPILHKPTFSADKTPNLLLLAVIAIGATTLDKAYGTSLTDSAAEFANFVIWHLRWEIVRDLDFRPPAKLWVFQTLLLIEVYEKMYATRALHERSHIHHDSTLTLMRRGSSLLGRSTSDTTPPTGIRIGETDKQLNGGTEQSKSEESWHRWIQTEATRRAAFGAFVLDSIHATMFGHAAKMVAHELRLPLPCDEGLWSSVSPAEAARVQSSLQTNGVKPTMFLDGLKKTLNGQRVRTNSFGRTIIMAGLLSVSWHMTQRDLQISSLGPRTANSFGGLDKWKSVLLRAFDNWKRDFDEALAEATPTPSSPLLRTTPTPVPGGNPHNTLRPVDDENIFESRTVLHHLAHIAAHVDIVDCQVFAGANRLLGRSVTPKDFALIREKIERWATKASARDAAFYALKFIAQVIVPPSEGDGGVDGRYYGHASPILPQAFEQNQYIARDDFLLNRPWVLYVSALVVWCYGFALEGPIQPTPKREDFDTYTKKERDMMSYLERVAGVRAPDDLERVEGKNRCLGLLMILKDSFGSTRWELTHEAAGLLGNACLKLRGMEDEEGSVMIGELGGKEGWDAAVREGRPGEMTVANAARVWPQPEGLRRSL